jgi:hypothetical protein
LFFTTNLLVNRGAIEKNSKIIRTITITQFTVLDRWIENMQQSPSIPGYVTFHAGWENLSIAKIILWVKKEL